MQNYDSLKDNFDNFSINSNQSKFFSGMKKLSELRFFSYEEKKSFAFKTFLQLKYAVIVLFIGLSIFFSFYFYNNYISVNTKYKKLLYNEISYSYFDNYNNDSNDEESYLSISDYNLTEILAINIDD